MVMNCGAPLLRHSYIGLVGFYWKCRDLGSNRYVEKCLFMIHHNMIFIVNAMSVWSNPLKLSGTLHKGVGSEQVVKFPLCILFISPPMGGF